MKRLAVALIALAVAGAAFAVAPSTDQYLVSVARVQGSCPGGICALFRTDTWVFNPSTTQSATVTIDFLKRDQANPTPFATKTVTVGAKATLELADIFNNVNGFNIDPATGALGITSNVPVVVTGRIYDVNVSTSQGTGTAGQFYPGLDAKLAIGNGQFVDVIGTAVQTDVWRTNLSIIETTGHDATLKIERIDSAGTTLGSIASYPVRAREAKQIGNVLTQMGSAPLSNQRIRVTVISGTGRVLVTASRLDSRTGDPFTIEMTTPAASGHTTGTFEGIINTSDGLRPDGGQRLIIGASGISSVAGITGLPCGGVTYTVDYDATASPPVTINPDGTFSVSIPNVPYVDDTSQIFTITWTVSGALGSTGAISGTVRSVTSGGTGSTWSPCNGTVDRTFLAGWVTD